jgi:release factor family 11
LVLHADIPTRAQLDRLLVNRDPASVSIYVPTDPVSANVGERIEFRNLAAQAAEQLRDAGVSKREVAAIEEEVADLVDDEDFWRYQARSLATFITPESMTTFRLPNRLLGAVEAADRFYVKPLLRTVTFPQVAFVLALAQGSVRLIEVSPDLEPDDVSLPDMPTDAASAAGRSSLGDRAPTRRIQGDEGRKLRLRQYARKVDQALRPFLSGLDVPLILAAAEPLESIYRSVAIRSAGLTPSSPPLHARCSTTSTRPRFGQRMSCSNDAGLRAEGWSTSATLRGRRLSGRSTRC